MSHDNPHDRAADAVHEGRPVEAQYVRGGRPGARILLLLIVSAGAAAILLFAIWAFSQGKMDETNANAGQQAVDTAAFDNAPAPSPDAPTGPTGQPAAPAQ